MRSFDKRLSKSFHISFEDYPGLLPVDFEFPKQVNFYKKLTKSELISKVMSI